MDTCKQLKDEEIAIPGFTDRMVLELAMRHLGSDLIIAELVRRGVVYQRGTVIDSFGIPVFFELKVTGANRVDL